MRVAVWHLSRTGEEGLCKLGLVESEQGDIQATTRLTWRAARSMASWPMWEEENEETRSSTERLMLGRAPPEGTSI